MAYRGGAAMSKLEYGSVLAASLAYLMNRQRDAAGLIEFDEQIITRLPASARPGHLHAILLALERMAPGRRSDVGRPLHQLAEALVKRSLVVLISDLLDDPDRVVSGLKHLRFRGTDVIVLQLLDPHELQFPFPRRVALHRRRERRRGHRGAIGRCAPGISRRWRPCRRRYENELRGAGIDFLTLDTSRPLDFALLAYLDARSEAEVGRAADALSHPGLPDWRHPHRAAHRPALAASRRRAARAVYGGSPAARPARSSARGGAGCATSCCSRPA